MAMWLASKMADKSLSGCGDSTRYTQAVSTVATGTEIHKLMYHIQPAARTGRTAGVTRPKLPGLAMIHASPE